MSMIYLNQAATTYPKPQCVLDAHTASLYRMPEGQFRSAADSRSDNIFDTCRRNIGKLLGISETERIFFSSGATDSSNAVIYGLPLKGRRVVTTQTEHNSILRPLMNLRDYVGEVTVVPCNPYGIVDPGAIEKAVSKDTAAVFVNHCSNVTGAVQDLKAIGSIAKKHGVLFVADVSQSAGCIPINADEWGIDVLIFTGHKSLFGVQGTGGYYVRSGVPFRPFRFGGTGRDSSKIIYNGEDYEYEPGTQNGPGIAALNAGVSYILGRTVDAIAGMEQELMRKLYEGLEKIRNVELYGSPETNAGPVMSFNIRGFLPSDVSYILQNGYGIVVRTGLQCAPLIHKCLGTEKHGTVRVSISDLTEEKEIGALVRAIEEIALSVEGEYETDRQN